MTSIVLLAVARPAHAQNLRLAVVDSAGRSATGAQVELLLVAWGEVRRVPIRMERGQSTVQLTEAWLRTHWPERAAVLESVHIYVRAPGHAIALSRPFALPLPGGAPVNVRFTRAVASIRSGATATLVLPLLPARSSVVQFVDDEGQPVGGVSVAASVFWSIANRCGFLVATDSLGAAVSDAQGRVALPGGDFEHTLALGNDAYVFHAQRSESSARDRLILRLDSGETRVALHRLPVVRLELTVTERDTRVQGLTLHATLAGCGCGACDGPLETTDAQGRIVIDAFRPEEWSAVELRDADGRVRWSGNPLDWTRGGAFDIRLDARAAR